MRRPLTIGIQPAEVYMMDTHVVILSGQLLFAGAIANRLRQYLQQVELEVLDPRQDNLMARITASRPSVVILDVTDCELDGLCSLNDLLFSFSKIKVIQLDRQGHIQVITSAQHPAVEVHDLVTIIESPF